MASVNEDASIAVRTDSTKASRTRRTSWRKIALRVFATAAMLTIAAALGWFAWRAYMGTPWTRDGTVRAYVVTIAPDVAGQVVNLPVRDNQFVHKGDLLMQIDPASYAIAEQQANAQVAQAKAVAQNAAAEWERRQKLNSLAVTVEEQQTYASQSLSAGAAYQLQLANLANARLNLKRTRIVSPVNGYVTNLQARAGDYANVGERQVSLIDADSFWVDAYFEETFLGAIHDGDAAAVKLMGYPQVLRGHVQSLARGISVANAVSSASGLATVNPIFAFVRLAQRVPVRIQLDSVPSDVRLIAGMTATVEIQSSLRVAVSATPPNPAALASAPPPAAAPARPPTSNPAGSSGDAAFGAAETSAEAMLPKLSIPQGAAGAAGVVPSAAPTHDVRASAAPQAQSPPRQAPSNSAKDEAQEIASDEALDRTLNILGTTAESRPATRAPDTLRRRGRRWRHDHP
jgi:RND family efflux transporter MFP subunit